MAKIKSSHFLRIVFIALILVGATLILWFSLRSARSFIQLQRSGISPGTRDVELVRGWMTLAYIAHAYNIPEDALYQSLGIPKEGQQKKSLADLNREFAPGKQGYILAEVKSAILRFQEGISQ
jgi:hypothetical protein